MGELHEKGYFHLQPVMLINEYNCLHFSEMDRLIKYKTEGVPGIENGAF